MSTNFNLAMLRNLHEPVSESLEAAIVQLSQYSAGTMDATSFSGAHHAHLVQGSLAVIGCRAASKVASLLEQAMSALPMPQTRGWSQDQALAVARLCQTLATQLLEHITRILSDMEDLPVRMWPTYQALHAHMALPTEATPEDLYEPDPDFQNLNFAPLAEEYLSSVVKGAISRLRDAISKVEASSDKQELEAGLQDAVKVFDWVYSLRHARGYQAYWLALSARISMGLLDEEILGDKGPWLVMLGTALIEMEKFARNNRRVDPELLAKSIRPLVSRWPSHWAQSHPTLAEANERLGIDLFWHTVDDVEASRVELVVQEGSDIPAVIEQVKVAWGRYVVAEGPNPGQALSDAVKAFSASYPESVQDHPGVRDLMESVLAAAGRMPKAGEVSDPLAVEFAAAVLLLEDALEGRGRSPSISDSQSALQRRRLHASLTGSLDQLQSLPRLRWDARKHERMLRSASASAFAQVQKDVSEIEEAVVERLRDDHVSLDMGVISRRATQASQVLSLIDAKPAAEIASAIVGLIERVDRNPGKELDPSVTLGIAALDTFLSARQAGDMEATHLLAEAYLAVTGEKLPYGYATQVDTEEVKRAAQDLIAKASGQSEALPDLAPDSSENEAVYVEEAPTEVQAPSSKEPARFDASMLAEGVSVVRAGHPTEAFFLEEMENVLAEIAIQRASLSSTPRDDEARQTLRRQFHTIKGSSRIAGFLPIGHAAERVEHYLDQAIVSRPSHTQDDDRVVERAIIDMKRWFQLLSAEQEARVDAQTIDAWFDGVSQNVEENEELADVPADDVPEEVMADLGTLEAQAAADEDDDVEIVSISGYGSMEYEAYYSMTEDLHSALDVLDALSLAGAGDTVDRVRFETAIRSVMGIGEALGAPVLARLPRAILENAQASSIGMGHSPSRVFASDLLSRASSELARAIRSLSDERAMPAVDTALLHDLKVDTDLMHESAVSPAQAAPSMVSPVEDSGAHQAIEAVDENQASDAQVEAVSDPADADFMDSITQGMDDDHPTPASGSPIEEAATPFHKPESTEGLDVSALAGDVAEEDVPGPSAEGATGEFAPDDAGSDAQEESLPVGAGLDLVGPGLDGTPIHAAAPSSPVSNDEDDHTDTPSSATDLDSTPGDHQAATDVDAEEDALWDEVFDNFEQISSCLRKIGPLLVSLSERRK